MGPTPSSFGCYTCIYFLKAWFSLGHILGVHTDCICPGLLYPSSCTIIVSTNPQATKHCTKEDSVHFQPNRLVKYGHVHCFCPGLIGHTFGRRFIATFREKQGRSFMNRSMMKIMMMMITMMMRMMIKWRTNLLDGQAPIITDPPRTSSTNLKIFCVLHMRYDM